jgi:hypothetical protein
MVSPPPSFLYILKKEATFYYITLLNISSQGKNYLNKRNVIASGCRILGTTATIIGNLGKRR